MISGMARTSADVSALKNLYKASSTRKTCMNIVKNTNECRMCKNSVSCVLKLNFNASNYSKIVASPNNIGFLSK